MKIVNALTWLAIGMVLGLILAGIIYQTTI
jgi:hypothetical protein